MKNFLLIIFISLLWNNTSLSENMFDGIGPPKEIEGICSYKKIYERQKPCDSLYELRDTINSIFFDLIPRPSNVSEQDFKNLISDRMDKIYNSPENIKLRKDAKKYRKKEVDLNCSVLAGQSNSWLTGRKIYKSCMKAEGY